MEETDYNTKLQSSGDMRRYIERKKESDEEMGVKGNRER